MTEVSTRRENGTTRVLTQPCFSTAFGTLFIARESYTPFLLHVKDLIAMPLRRSRAPNECRTVVHQGLSVMANQTVAGVCFSLMCAFYCGIAARASDSCKRIVTGAGRGSRSSSRVTTVSTTVRQFREGFLLMLKKLGPTH